MRIMGRIVVVAALPACAAIAGIETLSYEPDAVTPSEAGPSDGETPAPPREASVDAGPRIECAPAPPTFVSDFQDAATWNPARVGCVVAPPIFATCNGGPCVELTCRSTTLEAYNVLQIRNAAPRARRTEAIFRARLPRPAPTHVFAQAIWWMARDDNLTFVLDGDEVVLRRSASGRELARAPLDGREVHDFEVHLTLEPGDGQAASGTYRVVVDGQERTFVEPITESGPTAREPAFQLGPFISSPPDASATNRYDGFAMWACP